MRGVVGGVTVTDRLGFLDLRGDGVFSMSTSLLDDEDELLTDEVVVSRISRDMGANTLAEGFLAGRPGRLVTSLPETGAEVLTVFFGRPGPLRFGADSAGAETRAAAVDCLCRTSDTGRSSSLLLLSDSESRFKLALTFVCDCLTLRPGGALEPDEGKVGLGVT